MFSGLDTLRHGVNDFDAAPAGLALLPELLHQAGYATGAVTGGGFLPQGFFYAWGGEGWELCAYAKYEEGTFKGLTRGLAVTEIENDENLDPKTWCRFPILSGSFRRELSELKLPD